MPRDNRYLNETSGDRTETETQRIYVNPNPRLLNYTNYLMIFIDIVFNQNQW